MIFRNKKKFKKITLPVFVSIVSFYISALFFLGVLAGYVLMRYFSGRVGSIKFSLGSYRVHLHHWIYAIIGLAIMLSTGIYQVFPLFLLGLGGGFIFQGIYSYDDWHKVIYKVK